MCAAASLASAAVISAALIVDNIVVVDVVVVVDNVVGRAESAWDESAWAETTWATAQQVDEGVEPMGLQGVATAVATARPVAGGLPAPLGLGFEAGCHPGELHLVAEEPAPDTPVFVLAPAKVAVGVDPGPPQSLALLLRLAARIWVAASRSSWCEAPPFIRSSRSALASGVSLKVLVTSPSWGTESSPSCRASVKRGSLAARVAADNRPLAAPAEDPKRAPSHSAAVPCPTRVYSPLSTTRGANRATPEAATRSASLNRVTNWRAAAPDSAPGTERRATSRKSRIACSISAREAASEGGAASVGSVAETT